MGTKKENFESLSAELAAAKENFDLKKFAEKVLADLGKSEEEIAQAISQIKELGENNQAIQIKLDEESRLLVIANDFIEASKPVAEDLSIANGRIAELEALRDELNNEVDHAVAEISSLSKQLQVREAGAGKPGLLVDIDGEFHRLHGNNFSVKGHEGKLTADELSKRPDLLKQMKDSGSGALVPEVIN